jgi:hypothetical protein
MSFFILPLLSARNLDIGSEGCSPKDDISRGLMTRAIWKRPCINLFITYFPRADNMVLPFTRGQKTCYCPRKMLLPQRQITRRKLCFYYTCKFGVISIKYVIIPRNMIKCNCHRLKYLVLYYRKVIALILRNISEITL